MEEILDVAILVYSIQHDEVFIHKNELNLPLDLNVFKSANKNENYLIYLLQDEEIHTMLPVDKKFTMKEYVSKFKLGKL